MSATRVIDRSLQTSPGWPSFGTIHPVSLHRCLQGRPAWLPRWNQPTTARFLCIKRSTLTCIPANEVAFGFRCTRRTSLLELTTTRLAEYLKVDKSLPLDVLVTIVRDNETERSTGLFTRNLRIIMYQQTHTCQSLGGITWEYSPSTTPDILRLHYSTPGGTSNYRSMTHIVQ